MCNLFSLKSHELYAVVYPLQGIRVVYAISPGMTTTLADFLRTPKIKGWKIE